MNIIVLLSLFLIQLGCQNKSKPGDLDLVLAPKSAEAQKFAKAQGSAKPKIPELEWRPFFKGPPSTKESHVLKEKLVKWKDEVKDPKVLLAKARAEAALGQFAQAETTYRILLRHKNDHMDALLELAGLYLRLNQIDTCFDLLTEAHKRLNLSEVADPGYIFRYKYTLGMAHLARKEPEEAHRILGELVGIEPLFAPGYVALAQSYLSSGKLKASEFIVKRGLDKVPSDPALLNIFGSLQIKKGKVTEARRSFDQVIEENPEYVPALCNRARLAIDRREYEASEGDIKKALAISPSDQDAWILLGIIQKRTGRYEASKESFQRALEINPESAYARYNLAILMNLHFKEPQIALRLFHEVLQTKDDNQEIKEYAKTHIASMSEGWLQDSTKNADEPFE